MSVSVALALPPSEEGADNATVQVSAAVFGGAFNEPLVHQAVVAYLAGGRQGSKAQKSRSDVRGGGRKPWRQKGSGRARAGTIRSPLWRGGGRTFAARPQDHSVRLNRKMYRGALRSIIAELIRQQRILAVPPSFLSLDAPKTKLLVAKLASLDIAEALIVVAEVDQDLYLAARNLVGIELIAVDALNPVALVRHERVLIAVDALERLEERLK